MNNLFGKTSQPENFCLDTLAILNRRKVTFRGLPPYDIDIYLDGVIDVWFDGMGKDGKFQRKKITLMDYDPIKQAIHMGKPEVIANLVEQIIDTNSAKYF